VHRTIANLTRNRQIIILNVANDRDIDISFDALTQQHAGALFVVSDPFLFTRRQKLVALAARGELGNIRMRFVRWFAAICAAAMTTDCASSIDDGPVTSQLR
jgi:hypothetical protein